MISACSRKSMTKMDYLIKIFENVQDEPSWPRNRRNDFSFFLVVFQGNIIKVNCVVAMLCDFSMCYQFSYFLCCMGNENKHAIFPTIDTICVILQFERYVKIIAVGLQNKLIQENRKLRQNNLLYYPIPF